MSVDRSTVKKGGAAAAIAAMLAIATPFVAGWEGKSNTPYFDSVGVKTVCFGETRVEMRRYTDAECNALLRKGLEEFGAKVARLSPGIEDSPYEWAAHTSFAYNVGTGAYGKSSVRRLFNEGDRIAACRFMSRYKYAGGRVLAGLQYRRDGEGKRIGERELCLVGAIQKEFER
ncbi:lysozyme [Sphingomicrobium sp. XHP0235]|uniref:lysozyme n=1 Tax=Sphingomicrobium aquimarinum TaxID=3133971 RepID=UPI0031FED999